MPRIAGGWRVQRVESTSPAYLPALRMVLSGRSAPSPGADRQVNNLRILADQQGLGLDLLVGGYSRGRLTAAALAVESLGHTGLVYTSLPRRATATQVELVNVLVELRRQAQERGVLLLQVLLAEEEVTLARAFAAAGFRFLAELIYMDGPVPAAGATVDEPEAGPWRFVEYCPETHGLFLRALEESYVGSRDCPGLEGLRATEDVLAGHAATGQFDPRGWWVAMRDDVPAGVLLTARVVARAALEVVYMGVGADFRGQGVGKCLLARAGSAARACGVEVLTLAVDSTNGPALSLYQHWGFVEVTRRGAWIAGAERTCAGT